MAVPGRECGELGCRLGRHSIDGATCPPVVGADTADRYRARDIDPLNAAQIRLLERFGIPEAYSASARTPGRAADVWRRRCGRGSGHGDGLSRAHPG